MRSEFFWYPGIEATRIQFTKGQRWKRATDRGHLQGIEVIKKQNKMTLKLTLENYILFASLRQGVKTCQNHGGNYIWLHKNGMKRDDMPIYSQCPERVISNKLQQPYPTYPAAILQHCAWGLPGARGRESSAPRADRRAGKTAAAERDGEGADFIAMWVSWVAGAHEIHTVLIGENIWKYEHMGK
jgi:hypothetical protein